MSQSEKIESLKSLKSSIALGGGKDKIDKRHNDGKLTARERIDLLFDENSFVEVDAFIESRCFDFGMQKKKLAGDGVVTGYGTVDGRKVFVSSQDFTVIGGSLGEMHAKKITKVMDMALKMGAPFISINDSGGARIEEGLDALSGYGDIFYRNTLASGVIPQISVIMGPCAGGAVYSPAITDFIFMVDKTSQMFITGPQVIKSVTGEDVSAEALGGAEVHTGVSGVAHFKCANEQECIEDIKILLGFIPDNNVSDTVYYGVTDSADRIADSLNEIIPEESNKAYDMYEVIGHIVDDGNFMEIQSYFAQNIIIGFGRLNGKSVGIVANQPKVMAGSLDMNAADKAARFVRFCDAFNIPLLSLTDVPAFLPGVAQEHNGIIRHGAKLLYAFSEATVPKVNVILRKAYGGAYIAMNSKTIGADMVFAWPSAEIAVMGPDGAANIIFKKDIAASENPAETRKEKIEEYRDKFSNPYVAAARGYVDDVIEPSETRLRIIMALELLNTKRENRSAKKHGNIPL
ncbi:acetyl-CoA carboxylase carboxyltransferase component [Ruminiclostridium sufflavum DSM 19573]|uniref:Acetyl-CoA carboxylase carboxyltransferase component n=1 Tax=Ruminiclostridium sufflavum DSM 19573 TaxID=1121337 RepID=A0A318XJY4_9FIRM|nr:carboxyl transferase domain-containing protein [Ruminiclostridium sufflavum]PYG87585.1 acetyl-CoA carboxylase carboxyltransferase component [Ruminiclostridium sufflavum DSM 19573]